MARIPLEDERILERLHRKAVDGKRAEELAHKCQVAWERETILRQQRERDEERSRRERVARRRSAEARRRHAARAAQARDHRRRQEGLASAITARDDEQRDRIERVCYAQMMRAFHKGLCLRNNSARALDTVKQSTRLSILSRKCHYNDTASKIVSARLYKDAAVQNIQQTTVNANLYFQSRHRNNLEKVEENEKRRNEELRLWVDEKAKKMTMLQRDREQSLEKSREMAKRTSEMRRELLNYHRNKNS